MASWPEGTEPLKYKTWVLKVSIHCEGCKKKVRKILHGVQGVYAIDIDSKQNRVTVTGDVAAETLISWLWKHNKHAELLLDKKSSNNGSSGSLSGNPKSKGKEKAAAPAASVAPKTEEKPSNALNKKETEEAKSAEQPESTALPPVSAAVAVSGEAPASKSTETATKPSSDEPDKSEKDSENPALAVEKVTDGNKKGKQVQGDDSSRDGELANVPEVGTRRSSADCENQLPPYPFPAYPQPVYTMSYNTVHPSASYAYYASPLPALPSNYGYSGYPQPAMQSSYGYSGYRLPSMYYPTDSYYGSMESQAPSASYDMFNDENPNACKVM